MFLIHQIHIYKQEKQYEERKCGLCCIHLITRINKHQTSDITSLHHLKIVYFLAPSTEKFKCSNNVLLCITCSRILLGYNFYILF